MQNLAKYVAKCAAYMRKYATYMQIFAYAAYFHICNFENAIICGKLCDMLDFAYNQQPYQEFVSYHGILTGKML